VTKRIQSTPRRFSSARSRFSSFPSRFSSRPSRFSSFPPEVGGDEENSIDADVFRFGAVAALLGAHVFLFGAARFSSFSPDVDGDEEWLRDSRAPAPTAAAVSSTSASRQRLLRVVPRSTQTQRIAKAIGRLEPVSSQRAVRT
jgi:hypothetical protein